MSVVLYLLSGTPPLTPTRDATTFRAALRPLPWHPQGVPLLWTDRPLRGMVVVPLVGTRSKLVPILVFLLIPGHRRCLTWPGSRRLYAHLDQHQVPLLHVPGLRG